ncbi:MAG: efflux RND transporter permease subunit, partial [Pseudolabrys sp.]
TNAPSVVMLIDRDTAARFGIQPQLIDVTLYDAFGQRPIAQYFTQLNQYRVILEIVPELQRGPEALEKIYIRSPATGQMVPLSTFVRLDATKTN